MPGLIYHDRIDYDLISKTEHFRRGISELEHLSESSAACIMCAENDPIGCHRMVLVCRHIRSKDILNRHILKNSVEAHEDTELRMVRSIKNLPHELNDTRESLIKKANGIIAARLLRLNDADFILTLMFPL